MFVAVSEWRADRVNVVVPEWTARTLGWALDALGEKSTVRGVFVSCARCSLEIIGECTAFFPTAILIAAVLASPATWRARLLGLGLGIPALYLINLVRLVTLCYVYRSYPQAFETLHMLVWQSLMIFLTLVVWIVWFLLVGGREGPAEAAEAEAAP